jgi:hypothetical protein
MTSRCGDPRSSRDGAMLHGVKGCDKLRRAAREAVGFYWGSGLSNEVPALAWFLLASLVALALGITTAAIALGDHARAMVAERLSQALPTPCGSASDPGCCAMASSV